MPVIEAAEPLDIDAALEELQGQLTLIFSRARQVWKESAAAIHPELQVSGYKLLTMIARGGPTSAHELSERFELDKSVISRQVRMLEDAGLLDSRPDERDGRLRVLTATQQARSALAEVRGRHAARLRGVIETLSAEEIATASKVFRLLAEV